MKTNLYLTFFVSLLFTCAVNAQNYSPIVNGNTSLFQSEIDDNLYAMHVDSSKIVAGKEIFYFLKTVTKENNCFNYSSDWNGVKLFKDGNMYCFFNKEEDTIKLFPRKEIGETWKLYTYEDDSYIEATITTKEKISFLTLIDSVKTISLQLKDAAHAVVASVINGKTIQLSKNYGIISLFPFLDFPSSNPVYSLAGLSDPEVGLQLLTPRKIYNFNIGDEFHYEESYNNSPNGTETKRVLKITDKYASANTDTVKYTISDYSETTTHQYIPTISDTYSHASAVYTQKYIVNDSTIYPVKRINNSNPMGVQLNSYSLRSDPTAPNGKLTQYITTIYITQDEECWREVVDTPYENLNLLQGIGKLSHDLNWWFSYGNEHLVYYNKASETWGTPVTLGNYFKKDNASLRLYPNPLNQGEHVHFETANFQVEQVSIYNTTGDKILEFESAAEINTVDVSSLQSGLYMIQMVNSNNEFISSKFLIK